MEKIRYAIIEGSVNKVKKIIIVLGCRMWSIGDFQILLQNRLVCKKT
jgi:hypothetical protein